MSVVDGEREVYRIEDFRLAHGFVMPRATTGTTIVVSVINGAETAHLRPELLEKLGVEVDYPFDQTCCGQPMANSGAYREAKATEELFVRNFSGYEYVVAPSGSCVHHIRNKFTAADDTPERRHVRTHVWDLPEFLCDVLKVEHFPWAEFPHEVALHVSCSAIRGLDEQAMSERPNDPWFSKPRKLLESVEGVTVSDFDRPDECCGFGGTFAVTEEAV